MSAYGGGKIVKDGLILNIDASEFKQNNLLENLVLNGDLNNFYIYIKQLEKNKWRKMYI